jgi:outer membrane receptor for ferrienterochelin and colicins
LQLTGEKEMQKKLLAVLVPALFAGGQAWALPLADKLLPAVVVSATLSEHDTRTAPASVTVITREEIEAANPVDLLDAVRGEPGITLTGRSVGGRKTLAMRGLEGKHVLNLIDGRRISASDDTVGHSDYQYGWLPMAAIERIEVIRGPMSTLYGSEALGGVVNLITRKPADRWIGSVGIRGADLLEGDGGGRAGASVFAAGPLGSNFDLWFTGDKQRVSAVPEQGDPRYSELEGRDSMTTAFAAGWNFLPGQRLEVGWVDNQEDRWSDSVSRGTAYESRYDLERSHGHVTWQGRFEGWRAQANAYRSELDITNTRTNGVTATRPQNLRDEVLDGHAAIKLGAHTLTAGGEWRVETLKNAGLIGGKDDATHKALFLQDEVALSANWLLTAGLRADRHEFFGTEWSPRAYLVWEASPQLIVKGGYGHAFKAPTLKQVSPSYVGAEGPHTFYGNAAIQPESSDSIEIGADWQAGALNLRGVLFHTKVEDLIDYTLLRVDPGIPPRMHFLYDNVDKARVSGLEAGFTWDILPGLAWNTDLTLLRTKDKATGNELHNRPKTSATTRLDWRAGDGWSVRFGAEYIGRQLVETATGDDWLPAYALWNASVSRKFGKEFTARVGVENFTDVRLAEKSPEFGYAERGRTLFVNLRADF